MPRKKEGVIERDADLEELKETLLTEVIAKLDHPESEVADTPSEEPPSDEAVSDEEPSVVATDNVPKRYIANLYWELEPQAKDIFCGSYVFWESTNTINWESLNPKYSTDLEILSTSDILVTKEGRSYLISRWETPKEWIINLPFAALGDRYICKDVVELYETE